MKKLSIVIIVALAACTLHACRNSSTNTSESDEDTGKAVQDTSTILNLAVDKDDSTFAIEAAYGSLAEVEMGKLALKNGKSKKVKNFGAMMVKEHGKANIKLMAIVKAKNIAFPARPDTAAQKMLAELAKKTGGEFDKAYIGNMIADHQQDVKEFGEATKKLQDPDLKTFAKKTLPVLQKHLDAINAIHDSMDK